MKTIFEPSRRGFLALLFSGVFIPCEGKPATKPKVSARTRLLKKPIELGFEQTIPDPTLKHLKMLGEVTVNGVVGIDGILLRTLRLKNVADAVEARYGLPKGIILAMVAQESGGADLLPNGSDDGGIGFCHMQPSTASMFGMKIYQNNTKLVDHKHGHALRALIASNNSDRKLLIKYDDRFHPVLNLDAVGRMLKSYILSTPKGADSVSYALKRYSGRNEYGPIVQRWRSRFNDPKRIAQMKAEFDKQNPALTLGGTKINCDGYLAACREQNTNYGLKKYASIGVFK